MKDLQFILIPVAACSMWVTTDLSRFLTSALLDLRGLGREPILVRNCCKSNIFFHLFSNIFTIVAQFDDVPFCSSGLFHPVDQSCP